VAVHPHADPGAPLPSRAAGASVRARAATAGDEPDWLGAPASRRTPAALVPTAAARLVGLAALALVGGLEWRRMVAGVGAGRVLLWVAVAVATGAALAAAGRLARRREAATLAIAGVALVGALAASGIPLVLLKPARWDQLATGVAQGADSLGSVWLPYVGADPWPGRTLQLLGALLCVLAGLLAFWPRGAGRGYQFIALGGLIALAVTPVVSLGTARPLLIGGVLAAGTVTFLWLERLPVRPGVGLAALLAIVTAGAVPLAGVTDREQPWFDYEGFAEGLGPDHPVRFDWAQRYGPIDWPRLHTELLRISAADPAYWKLRTLEEFDGFAWRDRPADPGRSDPALDLPYGWRSHTEWIRSFRVSFRSLEAPEVVGAGTILRVTRSTRTLRSAGEPGMWRAVRPFESGDSYAARAYVPTPTASELGTSSSGRHADELGIDIPISNGGPAWLPQATGGLPVREAQVRFRPFAPYGRADAPSAAYPEVNRSGDGGEALRSSPYARTWRLAQRLRKRARTPYDYVALVAGRLRDGFIYSENPPPARPGQAPLDAFLFDSRSGYCQQYAGAMALLLRMGGVPARVAVGFSPGGYSDRKAAWIVRDTDAHAWVEAWFDRFGWVALDPTPPDTPARSLIASLIPTRGPAGSFAGTLGTEGATAQGASRGPQGGLRERPGEQPGARAASGGGSGGGTSPWRALPAAVALALAAFAAWRFARARRRRGEDGGRRVDRAIAELEAALRRTGRAPAPGLTLHQLERRLRGSPDAAAYLRALRTGRYGPVHALPAIPTGAQRRALRRALAAGGGPAARVRALWALPPWR